MSLLGIRGRAETRHDPAVREFLASVFPKGRPGDFNQAMMELGALVCRSRSPQCLAGAVRPACRAPREGTQEIIPQPKTLKLEKRDVVVAVIERNGLVLIQQRPPGGLLAGLWEFPGGKVEPGESLIAALRREIREELCVGIRSLRHLTTVRHAYTRFQVTLHAYACAAELAAHVCLAYSNVRELGAWPYHGPDGQPGQVRVPVRLAASSGEFLLRTTIAGDGVVLLPTFYVEDALRSGQLVQLLSDHTWPELSAYAVYPPTRHLPGRARAFIDFLAAQLG